MRNKSNNIVKRIWKQRELFLLLLPGLAFYLIFRYGPLYGILIAFKNYSPFKGVWDSQWVGFKYFVRLFTTKDLGHLMWNTLRLGVLELLICFPCTIIFALLLNEVRSVRCKKFYQTVSYLPSFLSIVIICTIFIDTFSIKGGVINNIITAFGGEAIYFNGKSQYYLLIYIVSEIWASIGAGAIVYLAALAGVEQNLYEAAAIDGCSRMKMVLHISIPCILPTIITMFLTRVGNVVRIAPDKTLLLYNDLTMDVADIIGTYVYRVGLVDKNYSFSTAVGLFESVLACIMLIVANRICKRTTGSALW